MYFTNAYGHMTKMAATPFLRQSSLEPNAYGLRTWYVV